MNKQDRKDLELIYSNILVQKDLLETIAESEQEKWDNMPENLQYSEKGQKFEESVSELQDLASELDCIMERIINLIQA